MSAAVAGVILNLAVWFAIHVVFHAVVPIELGPLSLDLPIPGSIDWRAAALSVLAVVAVFLFGLGIGPVLGGSAALGIALWLVGAI